MTAEGKPLIVALNSEGGVTLGATAGDQGPGLQVGRLDNNSQLVSTAGILSQADGTMMLKIKHEKEKTSAGLIVMPEQSPSLLLEASDGSKHGVDTKGSY